MCLYPDPVSLGPPATRVSIDIAASPLPDQLALDYSTHHTNYLLSPGGEAEAAGNGLERHRKSVLSGKIYIQEAEEQRLPTAP